MANSGSNRRVDHTWLPCLAHMSMLAQVLTVAGPIILSFPRLPRGMLGPGRNLDGDPVAYNGSPTYLYHLAFLLDEVLPHIPPMLKLFHLAYDMYRTMACPDRTYTIRIPSVQPLRTLDSFGRVSEKSISWSVGHLIIRRLGLTSSSLCCSKYWMQSNGMQWFIFSTTLIGTCE